MPDPRTQVDHVHKLNADALTAWRLQDHGLVDMRAYDLLIAEVCVAERLIEMPTNPAYWAIEDAAMLKVCIRRLHETAEAYHLAQQSAKVNATQDNLPL